VDGPTTTTPTGAPANAQSPGRPRVLTVNGGSSSLKFALFEVPDGPGNSPPARLHSGKVERVGRGDARMAVSDGQGHKSEHSVEAPDLGSTAGLLTGWLEKAVGPGAVAVVGHRVVHGGRRFFKPEPVTDAVLAELRRISPYDPDHMPGAVALIEAFGRLLPGVPQVACFDTAFHYEMPRVAQIVPIPRRFEATGVRRYGFHGLSYAYLVEELGRVAGPDVAAGRVVLAHLGSGASLAAVRGGRSVDTTMAFTPAAGIVMGTRSGDLDPGLVRFLSEAEGLSVRQFHDMVHHESGLLGVSETGADLRDLLARQQDDVRAAEAVELFCYQAKKAVGAFAAALGGLDALVFAGGVGENSPEVRRRICDGLGFLGVALDDARNAASAPLISADVGPAHGRVEVRVIRTDEELIIARAAAPFAARPGR
jgi:acetate kinase